MEPQTLPNNQESPLYPTGTVTFLFTDLEQSSRLWEQSPEAMQDAMARHDTILRAGVEANRGVIVKRTGDGLHAVFAIPDDALRSALAIQQSFLAQAWDNTGPFRVRMGLHTGQAHLREGDYYGPAVNRAARVMAVAAGGQVLLSNVTAELVRDQLPDGTSVSDLGRHRLRSLDRPERLFQLQHPELPGDFPPLNSLRTIPNNLPVQLSSFIGRETECSQIMRLLTPGTNENGQSSSKYKDRLITLTGPGGTGKTRLSLQVAGEILDSYPDGIWLVELAPLADPELVVQAVSEPFGQREQPGRPLLDMLIDYLQPRRTLIILDNCEHVIDACAQLSDALLRGCPRLHILASSREALGIAGERAFRVRSLSLPTNGESISQAELAGFDAIHLFVSRAETVKQDFKLTDDNAITILHICRRLDGIPLAIELAAARARLLSPQQILDRLDDRFRLLTGGSRTALPRQRTLQALIDWSYDLLSEEECALLRRLSVFSGGWTMEAAESVAGVDPLESYEILDLLELLHNKSLITAEEGDLGMRYRMLETIRQYAQAKLAQNGDADQIRGRHLAYFVGLHEQATAAIMDLHGGDWVARLAADVDNLRAAQAWALENDITSALRLMAGITFHWTSIIPAAEELHYLEKVIKLAERQPQFAVSEESSEERRLLGAALACGSNLSAALGTAKIGVFAVQAEAIAREQKDVPTLVAALLMKAVATYASGSLAEAGSYHQEINSLIAKLGHSFLKAMTLVSFGAVAISPNADGMKKGWESWKNGMAMFRQGGDFSGLAFGHQTASGVAFIFKIPAKVQYHAERSLEIYDELGDAHGVNIPRSRLADLARQRGELDQATSLYKQVVIGWRNVGQYGAMARCLECLAFIGHARAMMAGDESQTQWLRRSMTFLSVAAAIRQDHNSPMNLFERPEYVDELAKIKEAAGARGFQEAWNAGQSMDPDQVIVFMQEF